MTSALPPLRPELRDQLIDLGGFDTRQDRSELVHLGLASVYPDGWAHITPLGRAWLEAHPS